MVKSFFHCTILAARSWNCLVSLMRVGKDEQAYGYRRPARRSWEVVAACWRVFQNLEYAAKAVACLAVECRVVVVKALRFSMHRCK